VPRLRAISDKSGGDTPNQRTESSGGIALSIVSNGRSPVNIRFSISCSSVSCRSLASRL
jgi:hypothetical protein